MGGIKAGYIREWALKKEKWREKYILVEGKLYFGWVGMDFRWKIGGNRSCVVGKNIFLS
jgi:hypothetical protein